MCVDMASLSVVRPHTQIDYYHHLVPHLSEITNSSYYWGKMDRWDHFIFTVLYFISTFDRYEAEYLLEDKPEGSFLLRDSAQDEYLFSVSFRRYGRSLHARIEEQNHEFSFDCHDPGVYMNRNIPKLLDHYKVLSSSKLAPHTRILTITVVRTRPPACSLSRCCVTQSTRRTPSPSSLSPGQRYATPWTCTLMWTSSSSQSHSRSSSKSITIVTDSGSTDMISKANNLSSVTI